MTNDPIDQWLKMSIPNPELIDAHADLDYSLEKIIQLFIDSDTEIDAQDATWMTAIAVSYLYNFLLADRTQLDHVKGVHAEFRTLREKNKLEMLLQK